MYGLLKCVFFVTWCCIRYYLVLVGTFVSLKPWVNRSRGGSIPIVNRTGNSCSWTCMDLKWRWHCIGGWSYFPGMDYILSQMKHMHCQFMKSRNHSRVCSTCGPCQIHRRLMSSGPSVR